MYSNTNKPREQTREQQIEMLKHREVGCAMHRKYAVMCILPIEVIWICDRCGPGGILARAAIRGIGKD